MTRYRGERHRLVPRQIGNAGLAAAKRPQHSPPGGVGQGGIHPVKSRIFNHTVERSARRRSEGSGAGVRGDHDVVGEPDGPGRQDGLVCRLELAHGVR